MGTDSPDLMFRVAAQTKETYMIGSGCVFAGLAFWAVLSPYSATGDSADAANGPNSAVPVKILCT